MKISLEEKNNTKFFSFQATGTKWIVIVDPLSENKIDEIKSKITSIVTDFEQKYSRFKDDSILSILKQTGQYPNPPEDLINMINLGKELELVTEGHFNLSIGNVLESRGYDKNYSFESKEITKKTDDWLIQMNSEVIKITAGTQLDFGSFGKGYLIDLLFLDLKQLGFTSITINAGGDIYYFNSENKPKKFILENPFNLSEFIGEIEIVNSSISSSSNNRRKWRDKITGEIHSHLDSYLSNHKIEIAAVFTHSKTAIISDAIATCLFISPQNFHKILSDRYETEYLIILEDGRYVRSENYNGVLNA